MIRLTSPWLELPGLQRLFTLFEQQGATLCLVGGSVRDGLLGLPTNDIDLAVDRPPGWVMDLLIQNQIKAIPTGFEHGTVTAVLEGRPYQITTLRIDIKTFGRKAHVAFTEDWVGDAQRRDFTINAIYANKQGELFDPVGGIEDLKAHRVRFIGKASQRIQEDYLRILRFFRFSARFGHEPYDPEGLAACQAFGAHLPSLARERVTDEFFGILNLPSPLYALEAMRETGILAYIFHPHAWDDFKALLALEKKGELTPNILVRLAAFHPALEELKARFRLSKIQSTTLAFLSTDHPLVHERSYKLSTYQWGKDHTLALALLQTAQRLASREISLATGTHAFNHLQILLETLSPPSFPLKGKDLLTQGLPPGKKVGALLKTVEEWWIAEDFEPNREECLAYLKELL